MNCLPCSGFGGTLTVNGKSYPVGNWQAEVDLDTPADALLKAVRTFGQTIADALKPVLDAIKVFLGGEIAIAGQSYREPKVSVQTLALPSYQLLASVRRGILRAVELAEGHGVEAVGYFPSCDHTRLNIWLKTRTPARWEDHSAQAVMLAVDGDRLTITTTTTESKVRDRFALCLSDPRFVPALARRLGRYGIPFRED